MTRGLNGSGDPFIRNSYRRYLTKLAEHSGVPRTAENSLTLSLLDNNFAPHFKIQSAAVVSEQASIHQETP